MLLYPERTPHLRAVWWAAMGKSRTGLSTFPLEIRQRRELAPGQDGCDRSRLSNPYRCPEVGATAYDQRIHCPWLSSLSGSPNKQKPSCSGAGSSPPVFSSLAWDLPRLAPLRLHAFDSGHPQPGRRGSAALGAPAAGSQRSKQEQRARLQSSAGGEDAPGSAPT